MTFHEDSVPRLNFKVSRVWLCQSIKAVLSYQLAGEKQKRELQEMHLSWNRLHQLGLSSGQRAQEMPGLLRRWTSLINEANGKTVFAQVDANQYGNFALFRQSKLDLCNWISVRYFTSVEQETEYRVFSIDNSAWCSQRNYDIAE